MKAVIGEVSVMLFFGLFTFFGVMNVNASNNTESQIIAIASDQGIQIEQKMEAKFEEISALEEKNNAKVIIKNEKTSSKKVSIETVTKKTVKKKEASRSSFDARLRNEGGECFTSCLERNANPDVIISCAGACAGGDYIGCAGCIGVAVYVVASCAIECGTLLQ